MKTQYSLFDTLLEPTFVLNSELKVLYCNEPAALLTGHTVRKISRGMNFWDLISFNDEIPALKNIMQICDASPYKEVNFTTPQGNTGKVQITLQPIFDAMGDKNWLLFMRDVTLEERLQLKYRAEIEQKEVVISDLEKAQSQLQNYSKNLESMVAQRTVELSRLNQTMTAMLDSLSQGFFIFNAEGQILDVSSRACEKTVETRPNGLKIWEVLKLSPDKIEGFKKWMYTLFAEMLPFEDLSPLGPECYPHSQGLNISLEYHPLRTPEGSVGGVVVVASDITNLVQARLQAEQEKEHARLIIHLIKSRNEIRRFIGESQEMIEDLQKNLLSSEFDRDHVFRILHTLKGGAAQYSVQSVARSAHSAENLLSTWNQNGRAEDLLKFKDQCHRVFQDFIAFTKETSEILGPSITHKDRSIEMPLSKAMELLERMDSDSVSHSTRNLIWDLISQPLEDFVRPYDHLIQALSNKLEKRMAPLKTIKGDLRILPEHYNNLFATLVHAFRNAVDHGIEPPHIRSLRGKDEEGHIEIEFNIDANSLFIELRDDGQGIDPEKIRTKLDSLGYEHQNESDQEVIQHIFDSSFTTRSEVSDISGRGVGMDAIKKSVLDLKGSLLVTSKIGHGTCLSIQVPLKGTSKAMPLAA